MGQADDRSLAGAVRRDDTGDRTGTGPAGNRSQSDDLAARTPGRQRLLGQHLPGRRLQRQKGARHVHIEHALPVGRVQRQQRLYLRDAGIANHHVQPAETLDGQIHLGLDIVGVAHIHHQTAKLCTLFGLQPPCSLRHAIAIHVAEDQARTLSGKGPGQAQADALRGTRDGDHQAAAQGVRISCHGCA